MTHLKKLGEFGLIDRLKSRLKFRAPGTRLGIGDDCAVYESDRGTYQIVTTDAMVEKVHFDLKTISPEQLGRKALAVNISDIAAMGGVPRLALICLGIRPSLSVQFLDRLYSGINELCLRYGIELAGGDTVCSPKHLFINITLLGETPKNRLFTRSGAAPGDRIFVTGTLGDSALGLKLLKSPRKKWKGARGAIKELTHKHLDPEPRLRESRMLAKSTARITAMIDVSDGLGQDLYHLCEAANVGARLWEESLPIAPALSRVCSLNHLKPLDFILSGGEDYELLFTLKSEDVKKLLRQFHRANVPVTPIGEITSDSVAVTLRKRDGSLQVLPKGMGFNHFTPKGR